MLLFPLVALLDLPFLPHSFEGFLALLLLHLSEQQKFVFVPLKKKKTKKTNREIRSQHFLQSHVNKILKEQNVVHNIT